MLAATPLRQQKIVLPQEWDDKEQALLEGQESGIQKVETVKGGNGTFASSVFLLFNSAVGAGVLALPYCFLVAGIVPTTIAIIFFGCVTGLSSIAIVYSQEKFGSTDYQSIVKQSLGPKASYIMSAIIATYCLLNCVGALVIIGDNAGPVLVHFYGNQDVWWMERQTHIVVGATVAFPLMLFRQITALRYTAFLALASMCFIVCCVVQQVLSHSTEEQEAKYGPVTFFVPSISMCLALPSVCLAFQNQMQVPAIYAELRPEIKSVRNMAKIIIASKCIIIPMYVTTAFAGYYMFRTQTPPDVLDGAFAQSAVQIFVARLLLAFCAILRVPINHHTARSAVITLWKRIKQPEASETAPEPPLSFFLVEVLVFSAIMITLAMMLTSLDVVLDIMSATCAMAVMFFMPGLFFLKGQKNITSGWRTLSYAFMVIGASMACVSMCDVVAKL